MGGRRRHSGYWLLRIANPPGGGRPDDPAARSTLRQLKKAMVPKQGAIVSFVFQMLDPEGHKPCPDVDQNASGVSAGFWNPGPGGLE